jgi:hypothetical protein
MVDDGETEIRKNLLAGKMTAVGDQEIVIIVGSEFESAEDDQESKNQEGSASPGIFQGISAKEQRNHARLTIPGSPL